MDNNSIERLRKCLRENFDAYTQPFLTKSPAELIALAPEIAERKLMLDYLPQHCSADDAERLLRFANPLEVVRGIWVDNGNYEYDDEFDHLLWALRDKEDDYHSLHDPPEISSKKDSFEHMVQQIVPHPDDCVTAEWRTYALEMEMDGSPGFIGELESALGFIARNFRPETMQAVYEIIKYGSALPSELTAAAVYLESSDTPNTSERMAELAEAGALMCFHQPKSADEASPLALVSVVEDGKTETFYTLSYGNFEPEDALRCAKEYAVEHPCPVTEIIRDGFQSSILRKQYDLCRNPYTGSDPELTKAMLSIFKTCSAIAAHITINADSGQITTEHNPLWLQAAKTHEAPKAEQKTSSRCKRSRQER